MQDESGIRISSLSVLWSPLKLPPEPPKGSSGASFRLGKNQGGNPVCPTYAGSKWLRGLPSQLKQDQGPCLPTTTPQGQDHHLGCPTLLGGDWNHSKLVCSPEIAHSFEVGSSYQGSLKPIWAPGWLTLIFIPWKQRIYPESSASLWLAVQHLLNQLESWPGYDFFWSSGATSCLLQAIINMPFFT